MGIRDIFRASLLLVLASSVLACGGGGGGDAEEDAAVEDSIDGVADELIAESNASREGRYTYMTAASSMSCSDGTTVELPAVSDEGTLVVSGDSFTFTLDIAGSVPTPGSSASSSECVFTGEDSFECSGMYSDASSVTTFNGSGTFAGMGFSGADDLVLTLDTGVVCTWTQMYVAEKVADA